MKDFHTHILYGIDDGANDIEQSIKMIKESISNGITDILLTPHYIYKTRYHYNNRLKNFVLNSLNKRLKKEKLKIKLYLGNEVFITDNITDLIKEDEISTINNSKYVLIEFPLDNNYKGSRDVIYELVRNGYIPILAHPERYSIFQKNPDYMEDYLRLGLLLQGNYGSLFGAYGKYSKKVLAYYLKKRWISFMGSDCHHSHKYKETKIRKKLLRFTKDNNYVEELLNDNFQKVIDNKDIGIRHCSNR